MKKLALLCVLALGLTAGCALFAPSKEDLMAYCVSDPTAKKRAAELGMSVEQLCEMLLRDESPAPACDGGDAGTCAAR